MLADDNTPPDSERSPLRPKRSAADEESSEGDLLGSSSNLLLRRVGKTPIAPSTSHHRRPRFGKRQSNVFFPPGFSESLETYECRNTGVEFQAGYDSLEGVQPPKVLKYDAFAVIFTLSPWRALFRETMHATALHSRNMGWKLVFFSVVSVVFCMLSPLFERDSEEAIDALNSLMAAGLFFLLGPYVGNAVSRWWSVRKDGVGGLWGAVDDLSTYAAAWFWRDTPADREARALVRRLGLASHALLYKQARSADDELDDLVKAGLLLRHEADALAPLPSKAQVVWAWQTHFWSRALGGELAVSRVPNAETVAPVVMQKCMQGRGSIGLALAYIDTQQPFPYVHLLAILTDLALAVNAMYVGLHTGRQLFVPHPGGALEAPWRTESHLNVVLLLGFAAVRVAAFTLIYNGLLGIGVSLDNPIGDDPADLPGLAFQVYMKRESEAFCSGVDAIDLDGSKTGRVWWEGLHAPPPGGGGGGGGAPHARTPHTQSRPEPGKRPSIDAALGAAR